MIIQPIVEGQGDEAAVPLLLRRQQCGRSRAGPPRAHMPRSS